MVMPIPFNGYNDSNKFLDYQKADQAFQLQKALQLQQMQTAGTQNALQQFQLNKLQTGQLSPEEMLTAKLKLAEINSQNPSIFANQNPVTIESMMGGTGASAGQAAPQPMAQPNVAMPSQQQPSPTAPQQVSGTPNVGDTPINNPGNLRPVGASSGFLQFPTPEAGNKGLISDLTAKATGKSTAMGALPPTLRNIISVYAPAGDNNNPDAYTNFVAQKTGLNPDAPVNVADIATKIAPAMAQFEGGNSSASPKPQSASATYHLPISPEGQQLLDKLQPEYKARVQGYIDGSIQLPPPGSLARSGPGGKIANQLMDTALQIDPSLTETRYPVMQQFTTPNSKTASTVKSFGVALSHLDVLSGLADALNNGDVQALNAVGNTVKSQLGVPAPTNFEGAKQLVGDEIIKAVVGAGGGEGDRQAIQATLSKVSSPQQLSEMIGTYKQLMGGQLSGFQQQYQQATGGRTDFFDRFLPAQKTQLTNILSGNSTTNSPASAAPKPGTTMQGTDGTYLFNGGDPSKQSNWKKVQ